MSTASPSIDGRSRTNPAGTQEIQELLVQLEGGRVQSAAVTQPTMGTVLIGFEQPAN